MPCRVGTGHGRGVRRPGLAAKRRALNSVAGGLATCLLVQRGKVAARVGGVLADRVRQGIKPVVTGFVAQFMKEFHAGDTIVVDAENDEIVFRAIQGVEPPPVELAGSGTPE